MKESKSNLVVVVGKFVVCCCGWLGESRTHHITVTLPVKLACRLVQLQVTTSY